MKEYLDEQNIFKGGTLIINIDTIEMLNNDYTFEQGDKVRIALKDKASSNENVLYDEIETTVGEKSCSKTFTPEDTEILNIGNHYILQADLINQEGTFPMLLQYFYVVGRSIIPDEM